MISTQQIAWLAGLLEGEGSFMWTKTPVISVQMTDRDIVCRVASIIGGNVAGPYVNKYGHKPTWACRVYGPRAAGWMMTLFTFLGERRQAKISDVLTIWKAHTGHPKASPGRRLPAICHDDRIRVAFGKCKQCYMAQWRAKRKEAI